MMLRYMQRGLLSLMTLLLLQGCLSYSYKEMELVERNQKEPLLVDDVNIIKEETIFNSYMKVFAEENLAANVSDQHPDAAVQILIKKGKLEQSPNYGLGLLNIFVTGATLFLIPTKTEFVVPYEFIVVKNDKVIKTYKYQTSRDSFVWLFNFWQEKNKYWASEDGQYLSQKDMYENLTKRFVSDLAQDEGVIKQLNASPD